MKRFWLGKKKKKKEEIPAVEVRKVSLENEQVNVKHLNQKEEAELHDFQEISERFSKLKKEYNEVTSQLIDIQVLEQVPESEYEEIKNAASQIIDLSKQRDKIRKRNYKITDLQIKMIEPYEEEMVDELKKIKEQEAYQLVVRNDIHQLNSEKALLYYEKENIVQKQRSLKIVSLVLFTVLLALFGLYAWIFFYYEQDITIPFVTTIFLVVFVAGYITLESQKNRRKVALTEKKQNKTIGLLNKLKIKYVNCTNTLDYIYNKYRVKNSIELEHIWREYLKFKEESKRQQKTTKLLDEYYDTLLIELKRFHIQNPDIWIYQAEILISNKDMQEVKKRLQNRRDILKGQLEYYNRMMEKFQN